MKNSLKINSGLFLFLWLLSVINGVSQTNNQNYAHSITPLSAIKNSNNITSMSTAQRIDNIDYLDGLGRSVQQVLMAGSPSNKDIIGITDYDNTGRAPYQYLPFTNAAVYGTLGAYRNSASNLEYSFYSTAKPKFKTNTNAYSEIRFDNSPLGIVKESAAPAAAWNMTSGHTTKQDYAFNQANTILMWEPASNGAVSGDGITPVYYPENSLSEILSTNQDNITTKTYYDMSGQLIASFELVVVFPEKYNITYYVYNDFGEMTCVIPPAAVEYLLQNTVYKTTDVYDYLFLYQYDARGRVTQSKKPNQAANYFIYDKLDQVIFSQTTKMASSNQYFFYKYDKIGRSILTGTCTNDNPSTLQAQVNSSNAPLYESRSPQSNWQGYTNNALPTGKMDILTVSYYDDYDYNNDGSQDEVPDLTPIAGLRGFCTSSECQEKLQDETINVNYQTTGLFTGKRVRVLDNSGTWITTSVFYDEKAQLIQTTQKNYAGGYDINSFSYDFNGRVKYTQTKHSAYNDPMHTITYRPFYDRMGRLLQLFQKIDNNPVTLINQNKYNEIGQLVEKNIHSVNCQDFLQSEDYTYNELGMLTHVNNADLNNGGIDNNNDDADDLFGYELKYETPDLGGNVKYNGTINEVHWKSFSDAAKHAYSCQYDPADRLTDAKYYEMQSSWQYNGNYDEYQINYDPNGNITSLMRNGLGTDNNYEPIDDLTYQYNGNQLVHVDDAAPVQGYNGFAPMGSVNYAYDVNGNLISDPGKHVTMNYNFMDLPEFITAQGGTMQFLYDAEGTLLKRSIVTGIPPRNLTMVEYSIINGFNYYNGGLQYFGQPEGRVVPNPGVSPTFLNEYTLTDHLGNPRISFCDVNANGALDITSGEVLQENHYYPYGLDMYGLNKAQYGPVNINKFNGAEQYNELDLDLYNFGPRTYDAALGRWNSIDPMADAAPGWSPYRFGYDNPINVADPSGLLEDAFMNASEPAGVSSANGSSGGSENAIALKNPRHWYHNGKGNKESDYKYDEKPPDKSWTQVPNVVFNDGVTVWKGMADGTKKALGKYHGGSNSPAPSGGGSPAVEYGIGVASEIKDIGVGMLSTGIGLLTGDTWIASARSLMSVSTSVFNIYRNALDNDMEASDPEKMSQNIKDINHFMNDATPETWGRRTVDIAIFCLSLRGGAGGVAAKEGSNLVYHGLDAAGTVKYVGITERAAGVRFAEHLNSGTAKSLLDYRVIDGATGLTRTQARVWEQKLINQYGLGKNGGQLLNKVNSIAPKYWWQYGIK